MTTTPPATPPPAKPSPPIVELGSKSLNAILFLVIFALLLFGTRRDSDTKRDLEEVKAQLARVEKKLDALGARQSAAGAAHP